MPPSVSNFEKDKGESIMEWCQPFSMTVGKFLTGLDMPVALETLLCELINKEKFINLIVYSFWIWVKYQIKKFKEASVNKLVCSYEMDFSTAVL